MVCATCYSYWPHSLCCGSSRLDYSPSATPSELLWPGSSGPLSWRWPLRFAADGSLLPGCAFTSDAKDHKTSLSRMNPVLSCQELCCERANWNEGRPASLHGITLS